MIRKNYTETDRTINYIRHCYEPEELRKIGEEAAKRLREIGINARWVRVEEKPQPTHRFIKSFLIIWLALSLAFIGTIIVWFIAFPLIAFGELPINDPLNLEMVGRGPIIAGSILQTTVFVTVYLVTRWAKKIYPRKETKNVGELEDRIVIHQLGKRR